MKGICLLLLGIAGSAVLASGPTAAAQDSSTPIKTPWQQVTAQAIERTVSQTPGTPTTWRLSGSVRIVQETAIVTADEVVARIAPDGTMEYDLSGHVHLAIRPHK